MALAYPAPGVPQFPLVGNLSLATGADTTLDDSFDVVLPFGGSSTGSCPGASLVSNALQLYPGRYLVNWRIGARSTLNHTPNTTNNVFSCTMNPGTSGQVFFTVNSTTDTHILAGVAMDGLAFRGCDLHLHMSGMLHADLDAGTELQWVAYRQYHNGSTFVNAGQCVSSFFYDPSGGTGFYIPFDVTLNLPMPMNWASNDMSRSYVYVMLQTVGTGHTSSANIIMGYWDAWCDDVGDDYWNNTPGQDIYITQSTTGTIAVYSESGMRCRSVRHSEATVWYGQKILDVTALGTFKLKVYNYLLPAGLYGGYDPPSWRPAYLNAACTVSRLGP